MSFNLGYYVASNLILDTVVALDRAKAFLTFPIDGSANAAILSYRQFP